VSIFTRLAQEIENACLIAHIGIGGDSDVAGDGIGSDEANAIDISSQLVGIARNNLNRFIPVLLVNLDSIL